FATIFLGLTYLATRIGIAPDRSELETVNSMITRSVVGDASPYYYFVQITTALILMLAANTGFTGFPRLASVLANDRFMPRHFADVGSRLAFNTGILALAVVAGGILAAFGGSVNALVLTGSEQQLPRLGAPVVIVPIARLDRAALQALAFARSVSPHVKAVHVSGSRASAEEFRRRWQRLNTEIDLDVVESPYRSL